ncbi:Crp/Fnr family transcriptional regulator [Pseudenhygromyxa sp. WMMC2535]|uniref:Crp/Fnr family transcriptional regulator n=1 Tax=Pseudenhygromyxa sp. WMMC2535 TaxID=2712867 RepID=UPI001557E449|nr:Crp/Fnr family transcriptional regulator [Pseudenhygromyxa sp. WMMC2535]NVB41466.1 Crp/Fnr family transcriptional regulator [Pseudenhygromyxa sp. WMMC2535]
MESRRPSIPLERLSVEEMLACIEPFTAARNEEIEVLGRSVVRSRKPAQTVLIREGHSPDGLYVVLRGRVNLTRGADGGRDLILSSLGPGEVFGEACAVEGSGASSTAITAVPTDVARIPADVLSAHIRRDPNTLIRLMRLMNEKLSEVESVASALALYDVEERLRRTLIRLAKRQGRHSPADEGWILAPVPTQSELARMVGSCRETVSRTLSSMARSGLLSSSGRRMILGESLMQGA